MMIASQGIIIVLSSRKNQNRRARSLRKTRVYAAATLVINWPSTTSTATAKELPYCWTSGITSSAEA